MDFVLRPRGRVGPPGRPRTFSGIRRGRSNRSAVKMAPRQKPSPTTRPIVEKQEDAGIRLRVGVAAFSLASTPGPGEHGCLGRRHRRAAGDSLKISPAIVAGTQSFRHSPCDTGGGSPDERMSVVLPQLALCQSADAGERRGQRLVNHRAARKAAAPPDVFPSPLWLSLQPRSMLLAQGILRWTRQTVIRSFCKALRANGKEL